MYLGFFVSSMESVYKRIAPEMGFQPAGYALKRLFYARTPHVRKSLHGLRGRKHRQVYPSLISLGALNGDSTMHTVMVIQTDADKH